jgi:hypothetical protein
MCSGVQKINLLFKREHIMIGGSVSFRGGQEDMNFAELAHTEHASAGLISETSQSNKRLLCDPLYARLS